MGPDRQALVGTVDCRLTGDWRAALGVPEGLTMVRGHAQSRQARPGGTATHERRDAPQMAVLLRGGLLPPADAEPATRRATRALLRRRRLWGRQPHRQDHVPA
jgi:hypothetical protein